MTGPGARKEFEMRNLKHWARRGGVAAALAAMLAAAVPAAAAPFEVTDPELAAELGIGQAIVALPWLEREVLAAVYRRVGMLLVTSETRGGDDGPGWLFNWSKT